MKLFADAIKNFTALFSSASIKHLAFNVSETEQFIKHPKGPLGIVLRDQGMVDIYAGSVKQIYAINGDALLIANRYGINANLISFTVSDIVNFKLLGKNINPTIFAGKKLLAPKIDLTPLALVGPNTTVDQKTQKLINTVPATSVFEEVTLFETTKDSLLLPKEIWVHNILKGINI
jgi:hypothetical protein